MSQSRDEFPPQARHANEVALVSEGFASVVRGRAAWYVSSPLTSGELADEWRRKNQNEGDPLRQSTADSFKREVLERNRIEAATFVEALRAREHRVVIDPTAVGAVTDWAQSDYRALWASVIQKYVATIVFRDGWQYSSGCAWEFLTGYHAHCGLVHQDLTSLGLDEARSLLASAIARHSLNGRSFLTAVLHALDANGTT
jgi:hypothetical protein